jgi:hypothetical protein
MEEIVKLVTQKTGLAEDKAKVAVETVIAYLKDKLPGPIGGQIDNVLGGEGGGSKLGDIAQGLGGMLGRKG